MEHYTPKFRRDPNEMVQSIYYGVGPGGRMIKNVITKSRDGDHMVSTTTDEGLARGQGGQAACIILGGMETTLDEVEYLLEAKKEKKFVPRRTNKEIVDMCHALQERRNEAIMDARKHPTSTPKKPPVRLHLPVGYHYAPTGVPGLKILAKV